jgi:hypothetical protein
MTKKKSRHPRPLTRKVRTRIGLLWVSDAAYKAAMAKLDGKPVTEESICNSTKPSNNTDTNSK